MSSVTDVTIEMCRSRADAERRKEYIRAAAPGTNYSSRIIEGVATLALFLTPDPEPGADMTRLASTTAADLDAATAVALIIWAD